MSAQLFRYKCGCVGTEKGADGQAIIVATCDSTSYQMEKRKVEGGQPLLFEAETEFVQKFNNAIEELENEARFLQEIRQSVGGFARLFRASSI